MEGRERGRSCAGPLPGPPGARVLRPAAGRPAQPAAHPLRLGVHFPAVGPPVAPVSHPFQPPEALWAFRPGLRILRCPSRAPVPLSRGNPAGAAARLQAAVLPPAWRGRRKPAGFPKRRAAAGCALGAGRARGAGRAAGEPWSAAGRAGSPETLFGEKFSLRSFPPSPVLAHTPPARRASTSSLGSLGPGLEGSDPFIPRQAWPLKNTGNKSEVRKAAVKCRPVTPSQPGMLRS